MATYCVCDCILPEDQYHVVSLCRKKEIAAYRDMELMLQSRARIAEQRLLYVALTTILATGALSAGLQVSCVRMVRRDTTYRTT